MLDPYVCALPVRSVASAATRTGHFGRGGVDGESQGPGGNWTVHCSWRSARAAQAPSNASSTIEISIFAMRAL